MSELHPLTKPFQLGNTAQWRQRDETRDAIEDLRNAADEAMLCLEPGDELQGKLPQASIALQEAEQAIKRLWPTLNPNRPKIICLCGSSRYVDVSAVKAWEFNKQGIATFMMPLLPQWYPGVQEHHQAEAEGVAVHLDNLWLGLIALADEVFVVNANGYIGERTRIEINHAESLGKPVRYLEAI